MSTAAEFKRIRIDEVRGVTIVRFNDHRIIEDNQIQEIKQELFSLVDAENHRKILINFDEVDFVSSAMFGGFIGLHRRVTERNGKLVLCTVHPAVYNVFATTKLNRLFDIKDDLDTALLALSSSGF